MGRRRWLLAGLVVVVAAGAIAWSVAARGEDEHGAFAGELTLLNGVVPARAGITLPPATPLGAGLDVAEGSYLLGGPLPYLYSTDHGGDPIEDDGFEARLLVTDPIRDVLERYRAQAVAAGFEMTPVRCVERGGVLGCSTECRMSCGFPYETGYEHGRRLGIFGEQGPGSGPVPPQSWASIVYRHIGDPPFPTDKDIFPPLEQTTARGTPPADWPPLPEVSEPIYSFNDFEVAAGTVLLAHGIGAANLSTDTTAIFEVTDDIDTVIDRFVSQPRFRPRPEDLHRSTLRRNGNRVDTVGWTDGHGQTLTFYDLADGPTILVLSSTQAD